MRRCTAKSSTTRITAFGQNTAWAGFTCVKHHAVKKHDLAKFCKPNGTPNESLFELANSIRSSSSSSMCPCPQLILTFAGNEEYQQQSRAEQDKEQQLSTKATADLVQTNYSAHAPCIARTLLLQPMHPAWSAATTSVQTVATVAKTAVGLAAGSNSQPWIHVTIADVAIYVEAMLLGELLQVSMRRPSCNSPSCAANCLSRSSTWVRNWTSRHSNMFCSSPRCSVRCLT